MINPQSGRELSRARMALWRRLRLWVTIARKADDIRRAKKNRISRRGAALRIQDLGAVARRGESAVGSAIAARANRANPRNLYRLGRNLGHQREDEGRPDGHQDAARRRVGPRAMERVPQGGLSDRR